MFTLQSLAPPQKIFEFSSENGIFQCIFMLACNSRILILISPQTEQNLLGILALLMRRTCTPKPPCMATPMVVDPINLYSQLACSDTVGRTQTHNMQLNVNLYGNVSLLIIGYKLDLLYITDCALLLLSLIIHRRKTAIGLTNTYNNTYRKQYETQKTQKRKK